MIAQTTRRSILRAAGLSITLPTFLSFRTGPASAKPTQRSDTPPKRFVGICETFGMYAPNLFPAKTGADYEPTRYLKRLAEHRNDFTLFSGLAHPGVGGGHAAERSFLSAAPDPQSPGFHNTISLDQVVANAYGNQTRLPSLALQTSQNPGKEMSIDPFGQTLPMASDLRAIFALMFLTDNSGQQAKVVAELKKRRSVIDSVLDDVNRMSGQINSNDRQRLDEYLSALRAVEKRMIRSETWERTPRPRVDYDLPRQLPAGPDVDAVSSIMYDLIALAIRSDSTRSVALKIVGTGSKPKINGVAESYHGLSHHGQDEGKIAQLALVEEALGDQFGNFLTQLSEAKDVDGSRLLDQTVVLRGSNLGNASSHSTRELPIFVAGGGFNHGHHIGFDPDSHPPLSNLYLKLLHQLDIPAERFGASNGTIDFSS